MRMKTDLTFARRYEVKLAADFERHGSQWRTVLLHDTPL